MDDAVLKEWLPVIGRSIAQLCLNNSLENGKTIAEKALFLEKLGVSRKDVASMLDTSPASISELLRVANNKKKGKGKKSGKKTK